MKSHSKDLVVIAVSKQIPVAYSADCGSNNTKIDKKGLWMSESLEKDR